MFDTQNWRFDPQYPNYIDFEVNGSTSHITQQWALAWYCLLRCYSKSVYFVDLLSNLTTGTNIFPALAGITLKLT